MHKVYTKMQCNAQKIIKRKINGKSLRNSQTTLKSDDTFFHAFSLITLLQLFTISQYFIEQT